MAGMASATPATLSQTPRIFHESRKVGLISIVEEELEAEDQPPLGSPSVKVPPTWRDVEYFGNAKSKSVKGLGFTSAFNTGSPLMTAFESSPGASPGPASPRVTTSIWDALPSRISPLGAASPPQFPFEAYNQGSNMFAGLSSVIPDISDDEASRQNSIAELEVALRKASIALSQIDVHVETVSDTRIRITEESDVLGPLHSPSTPLSPSLRTSYAPTSPRASSDYLKKACSHDDQSAGAATPPRGKRPSMDPFVVFKKINNFADLHSFSFGQGSKSRKETDAGQDLMTSPRMSTESSIQRPSSAYLSLGNSVEGEAIRDVMLINPITGERKMSAIRPTSAGEPSTLPSALRRNSSAQTMYTMVRRESLATSRLPTPSTASRPSISARNPSIMSSDDQRHMSTASTSQPRTLSFAIDQRDRNHSSSTRHMSSAWNARNMSTARTMSHSSYARTMSSARTMSNSTWSRTMSTFSRASSVTTYDGETDNSTSRQLQDDCADGKPRRKSSFFTPMFDNIRWSRTDSAIAFPIQESTPAYQEALTDVEEDPDFVEIEVQPKAGSIVRRASLLANVFSNNDVDVDPDLQFEPSASESEIKQSVAEAQIDRSQRKMTYSRNIAITSFAITNAACITLSFGLLSVWYALVPLILAAPLLRSAMTLDLLGCYAYKKAKTFVQRPKEEEEKLEPPTMNYATIMIFSNESRDEIETSLDSLVNQQGVNMHRNLLIISCNDQMLDVNCAKTTTRVLLEHVFTDIFDEKRFELPREEDEYEFDHLWCRRGTFKGLPYVLMIKEGETGKTQTLNLLRNLLRSYNLRKEPHIKSVPTALLAWYREWAELHRFESFDFLVKTSPDTVLDKHCISELYRQSLKDSNCIGVSSRVEVNSDSHKWTFGNLFDNAYLMHDQLKQTHQSQITDKVTTTPGSCQMLKICDETCGPQILEDIKSRRPSPMSNMVKQVCSLVEEDDMMIHASAEGSTRQAVRAVTNIHPTTSLSEFLSQRQKLALSTCADNLAVLCNSQMHWFDELSSATELLTWCLPVFSLVIIVNFIRAATLLQNIPVLILLGSVVTLPWIYAFMSSMLLARSWEARLRYLLGFFILMITGPFIAIYAVAFTVFNLHRLGRSQFRNRRISETIKIRVSDV